MLTPEEITDFTSISPPAGADPWVQGQGPSRDISIAEPDPTWPSTFERLARGIRRTLGDVALSVEHVGSNLGPRPTRQADGAVVVVRHNRTTRDQLAHALERLEAVDSKALGVVINIGPASRSGAGAGAGYASEVTLDVDIPSVCAARWHWRQHKRSEGQVGTRTSAPRRTGCRPRHSRKRRIRSREPSSSMAHRPWRARFACPIRAVANPDFGRLGAD